MTLEQRFYNIGICLWKTDESKMTKADINTIINLAKEKILGQEYDDIEITEDNENGSVYMDIGYNGGDPYYVEDNLDYNPGCPETGPSYSCAGEPAEPSYVDGTYESERELWDKFFKALPKDIDYDIMDSEYDSEEDVCIRAEGTDGPDPDQAYEEWRDSQYLDF